MEALDVIRDFLRPRNIGSGDGSGYGSGYGSGDGSGYGSGDGYGDGYGDGSGYGSGLISFNGEKVWYVDGVPTLIDHVRGDHAVGRIILDDLTTEPCYIARVENCFAHGDSLKDAVADAESKAMEELPVETRISRFMEAFPTLDATARCSEFYRWHHTLTGSCRMGRDAFVREHSLDMEKEYTVRYFLDITKWSYGGRVMVQLLDAYGAD